MDCGIEDFGIGECLMGEVMDFEVAPDALDVIEFGRIFWEPFDREPMGASGEFSLCGFADVDRTVVEHNNGRAWCSHLAWGRTAGRGSPKAR